MDACHVRYHRAPETSIVAFNNLFPLWWWRGEFPLKRVKHAMPLKIPTEDFKLAAELRGVALGGRVWGRDLSFGAAPPVVDGTWRRCVNTQGPRSRRAYAVVGREDARMAAVVMEAMK